MTDRETRTVLLVDESVTMLYYYGILLKRLEYAVLTAATPEDALKIMEHTVPSLILTAISFPSMNGIDFIKTVKRGERTKTVPVIVITAEEEDSVRSACLRLGCIAYLIKPVDAGALYLTIQNILEATPRENIRINTLLKTVVGEEDAKDAAECIEYATAISEKGAYVRTLAPKAKDALIPIRIYLKDREIKAKAVVLYTHAIERGAFREPGMGLKFVEISEDDRIYLRNFINAQLTSDIAIIP
jgi:twitching motility two-component system response regulator PilH